MHLSALEPTGPTYSIPIIMIYRIAALSLVLVCAFAQQGQQQQPPFLERATSQERDSFAQLMQAAGGLTDAQVDQRVQQWVAQQSDNVKTDFAQFQTQMKQMQAEGEKAHQQAIANFSPAAKQADSELSKIANDQSLTVAQKGQKIDAFMSNLKRTNPSVAQEIEGAMQG